MDLCGPYICRFFGDLDILTVDDISGLLVEKVDNEVMIYPRD